MVKYRITYIGNDKYLAWDAEKQRFIPAYMHLYVTTYDTIDAALTEMRKVQKSHSGWSSDIYIDSIQRCPYYEHMPEVKKFLFQF